MIIERLWLLSLLPLSLLFLYFLRKKGSYNIPYPDTSVIPKDGLSKIILWARRISVFGLLALIILFAASPTDIRKEGLKFGYGADIIFVLDESGSMAEDFSSPSQSQTNEAEKDEETVSKFMAAKDVIKKFMEKRKTGRDRYGLIVFGTTAINAMPLTFNHDAFLSALDAQESVLSSTVIFRPLLLAIRELMNSDARSKIIVLVSDGGGIIRDEDNKVSDYIKKYGIKLYWIGIDIDNTMEEMPKLMEKIGSLGKEANVNNSKELETAFNEIDSAERSIITYRTSIPVFSCNILRYAILGLFLIIWFTTVITIDRDPTGRRNR